MKYADRKGNVIGEDNGQDKMLKKLYGTVAGRMLVKVLVNPVFSKIGGAVLSTSVSSLAIPSFCKKNSIDMSDYEEVKYTSYNDFFTRRIKAGRRLFNPNPDVLISPCDSKLSVYAIGENLHFNVKNTMYTVYSLLRDKSLAASYKGGYACVFRLTVDDYHRYAYIDNGYVTRQRFIKGVLHTVNPVANDCYPIYKENSRAYSILKSENFGNVVMMEVGALMVGKIVNEKGQRYVCRGQEKGHFEFGGSTIILLFKKNRAVIDEDILNNSRRGIETKVRLGETIGHA
ncbi:MAG: phosphatidylserine decarboxylase [Eubacteriales bacterium]|nr:phosphatidylserine decarboxylase [Eubacteriales bacterium]